MYSTYIFLGTSIHRCVYLDLNPFHRQIQFSCLMGPCQQAIYFNKNFPLLLYVHLLDFMQVLFTYSASLV